MSPILLSIPVFFAAGQVEILNFFLCFYHTHDIQEEKRCFLCALKMFQNVATKDISFLVCRNVHSVIVYTKW